MMEKGLSAQSKVTVDGGNVAATLGSGDLQVFATPAMVALMENAAMKAVADHLPEGSTTVGAEMNVTHIKPSGVGAEIVASAVLTEARGSTSAMSSIVRSSCPKFADAESCPGSNGRKK